MDSEGLSSNFTNYTNSAAASASADGGSGTRSAARPHAGHSEESGTRRGDGRGRRRRRVERGPQNEDPGAGNVGEPSGANRGDGAPRGRGGGQRGRGRGGRDKLQRPSRLMPGSQLQELNLAEGSGRLSPVSGSASGVGDAPVGQRRRRMMNAKLTDSGDANQATKPDANNDRKTSRPRERRDVPVAAVGSAPGADTLAGRLTKSLRTAPYMDCPICFNAIHPAQPIWSCAPGSGVSKDVGTFTSLLSGFCDVR